MVQNDEPRHNNNDRPAWWGFWLYWVVLVGGILLGIHYEWVN